MSGNNGTATITIEDSDNFEKLTELNLRELEITSMNVLAATNLESLNLIRNTGLTAMDISTLPKIHTFIAGKANIIRMDISNNPLMKVFSIDGGTGQDNDAADQIVIQLDEFGLSDGALYLHDGDIVLSARSYHAYQCLQAKGWKLYVEKEPPVPVVPILSNITPSGNLGIGTVSTKLAFSTDQKATCRYSIIANASFAQTRYGRR